MNSIEKRKQTTIEKHGVNNVSKLSWVQDKRRKTFESKRHTILFYQEPRIHIVNGAELQVYRLDKKCADNWLNTYHPFGAPRGNVLCLGLVKDGQIYCMMTFKKSRDKQYTAELSRLWMLPTYNVVNGYDILSEEASKFGVDSIIAYVNMSFENCQDYQSIGMKYIRDMQRTRWWIKGAKRMSDASRRQYKKSCEDMLSAGFLPVYDCGMRVYVF